MEIRLTANARRRLQQIRDYFKSIGNPKKGKRIAKQIQAETNRLKDNPELGQEEDYLKELGEGHRYLLVDKFYKVIYLVIKPFIVITDIFDTRQDPDKMKP